MAWASQALVIDKLPSVLVAIDAATTLPVQLFGS
jgi:hypothetical protein